MTDKPLSWHYGPTNTDPETGNMWCYGCGGQVYVFKDGIATCSGCGAEESSDTPEETP